MKTRLFILGAALCALAACTPVTTTTPGADSLAVAVDSPIVQVDTPQVDVATPTDSVAETTPVAEGGTTPAENGKVTAETGKKAADGGLVTTYRLTVSFISIGAGVDQKAKANWDKFVADYELKNKVKLAHETVSWGREGEVDYCYKLAELKDPKLSAFVAECKAQVLGNKLVQLKENANCRVPRK
jgi:hypothetical protein